MNNEIKKFEMDKKYPIYSASMKFGIIGDKKYNMQIDNEYNLNLLTEDKISMSSIFTGKYYITRVNIENLDDIVNEYLYVKYNNNLYKVLGVENGFSKFYLAGRGYGYFEDDKKLGFSYNDFFGAVMLEVSKEEVEVFSKTESIYENIKKQMDCYNSQKKTL